MQKSLAVRDAQNNAIETTIGASAVLKLRSGAAPATQSPASASWTVHPPTPA